MFGSVAHPQPPGTADGQSPQRPTTITPSLGTVGTATITSAWVANGYDGTGVKVGIIDWFDPTALDGAIATGNLPSIPSANRRCYTGVAQCTFGTPGVGHGVAIAETIADDAPGVTLYLVEALDLQGVYTAIDWLASKGVSIVNHSLLSPYDGPGDGTGPAAAVVDYAVTKGMAWFQTAGDFGLLGTTYYPGGHWRGTWYDPDGDRWLNFKGTDEALGTYCGALMGLRWSDWGAGRTDYELWVGDLNGTSGGLGTPVLASDANQAAGAAPLEGNDLRWLCNTNAAAGPVYDKNKDGFVAVRVKRSSRSTSASASGDTIELAVISGWFEYATAPYSAAVPFADSRNLGELTVSGTSGFSPSQGPTNEGRLKPDIQAPTCHATTVYGPCATNDSYYSADFSTAHATGAAAVVLDALGPMQPWQIAQYFRNYSQTPATGTTWQAVPAIPNSVDGYGTLSLFGSGPSHTPPVATTFVPETGRVYDTRNYSVLRGYSNAPLPVNSAFSYKFFDGFVSPAPPKRLSVVLNITVTNATGPGFVQVSPTGLAAPGSVSSVNVERAGQTVANVVVVPLGPSQEFTVYSYSGGHIVVDILGSFKATNGWTPNGYVAVDPIRAHDSHCPTCTALAGGTYRDVKVTGVGTNTDPVGWVPPSATAVAVSVTADGPTGDGFISAVATTVNPPMPTSTANYQGGKSVTGFSIVPVSADGKIRIYSHTNTHFQVDVLGFFAATLGGDFTSVTPFRALDTRDLNGGALPAAGTRSTVDVATNGVPLDSGAVVGNLTTTQTTSAGALKIARSPSAVEREFRNVTMSTANQIIAGGVFSGTDNGHVEVVATSAAHRIFDVSGWFAPVRRAKPGEITPAPYEATPGRARTPVLSADGTKVVWVEDASPGGPAGQIFKIWDRDTDTVTVVDTTAGADPPNGYLYLVGASSDGERVLFHGTATNITADDTLSDDDYFLADVAAGTVTRVNLNPNGTRIAEQVYFDTEVTKMAFASTTSFVPADTDVGWDVYETDLATDTTTLLISLDTWPGTLTFNQTLNAAYYSGHIWRRNGAAVLRTIPFQFAFSDDGRYLVEKVSSTGINKLILVDLDTMDESLLCNPGGMVYEIPPIDWSGGLPPVGSWCIVSPFLPHVVTHDGEQLPAVTWNGLFPQGTITISAPQAGVVAMAVQNSAKLLPGSNLPMWIYVYDPTP